MLSAGRLNQMWLQKKWRNGRTEKMETQRRLERITTTFSLVGLALGIFLLGILTLVNRQSQDASIAGGFIDILLRTAFLRSAFT
jgi:hypothetical protein